MDQTGSAGGSARGSSSSKIPEVFRATKAPLGDVKIVVKGGQINKTPKGIDPRTWCSISVEGAAGETERVPPTQKEWKTEFKFGVAEMDVVIEVQLQTSHMDLVTQEPRSSREGSAAVHLFAIENKDAKEVVQKVECKKGGKGKVTGHVNMSCRFVARKDHFAPLSKMLFESAGLTTLLLDAMKGADNLNDVAKGLLFIYWCNNREQLLLELCLKHEMAILAKSGGPSNDGRSDDTTQLLRGSTISILILSEYMKILCEPYLRELLGPLVRPLAQGAQRFEVDPGKLPGEEEDVEKLRKRNQKNLLELVSKFVKKILKSSAALPPDIGELCRMLKKVVDERFPDNPHAFTQAAGALFFLRFLCPAIAAPEIAGLVQGECGIEGRRCLVLVTKVIQNLVNNVDFGDKEEYMTCMNPFIEKNRSKPVEFYQQILKKKNGKLLEDSLVQRRVPTIHYERLAESLIKESPRLQEKIETTLGSETADEFRLLQPVLKEALDNEQKERELLASPKKRKVGRSAPGSARPRKSTSQGTSPSMSPASSSTDLHALAASSNSPRSHIERAQKSDIVRRKSLSDVSEDSSVIMRPTTPPPSPLTASGAPATLRSKKHAKMTASAPSTLESVVED